MAEDKLPNQALERIDQMLKLLQQDRAEAQKDREVFRNTVHTLVDALEQMRDHWAMAERNMAASSRLEGNLREGIADLERMIDKLPGRRIR